MKKNETLRQNQRFSMWEIASALMIVVIVSINAFLAFKTIDDLSQRHARVTNTGNIIAAIKNLHIAILLLESGQRGYLLTDNEEYLEPYHRALDNLHLRIRAVKDIRTEIPGQAQRISHLVSLIEEKKDSLVQAVELGIADKEFKAMKIIESDRGLSLYIDIAAYFEEIEGYEFAWQADLFSKLTKLQKDSRTLFFVFIFISSVLLCLLLVLMKKSTLKEHNHRKELEERAEKLEDIVEERTKDLTLYAEKLAYSNRELEEFAFVASHDLQEPLRKIRAFSDRVKNLYSSQLDEKGADYLNRMNNAAVRMSVLIQDLLAFSRITTQGGTFTDVDLNELVSGVIDDLEVAIDTSQAVIHCDNLPVIQADSRQINQLMLNVLSNALKFQRKDIAPIIYITSTHISVTENDSTIDYYELRIKDNGIGFDQSYADKIFMPFQRLHARETYEGTGIGLAIVRRIIERHNGTVTVVTEEGIGSEFIFRIPVENDQIDNTPVTSIT